MMSVLTLKGSRVLLTGASGFIGGALKDRLLSDGVQVHAVSRSARTSDEPGLHWHQADLADERAVQQLFADVRPDGVFHLASEVTGGRETGLVVPTLKGNLLGAVHILSAATEQGCRRVVLAGSLEEPDGSEAATAVPCSPYAAAKWAASGYARMFHALYQTPAVLARLFMVYGPGQHDFRKLVPYVSRALAQGVSPQLSSGHRPVDWVFVDDVVEGLVRMAQTPGIDGQTVDLGSGELHTIREVVTLLCELSAPCPAPAFGALPDRPLEQVKVADTDQTQRQLGWRPCTPLRQGLQRTVDWVRALPA
ncbi:NAD(P)-dependent oxidoreductase [Hydrogenophaga sp.]|uniref:NAD-dependent epimerase/dehydratase family protein n=1 Tax=Hydrogenophaga sp. TaxID=1904254 RepID=UPI0026089933|nr:NAD(P)-dependent oxidoreductase [Hydrogenophaga sp.]MCW5652254.1 NAD(P)-dependent oxidoreductase [Hydrogenophaga sp.]